LVAAKRGAFESRVRKEPIALAEVVRRNASGRRGRAARAAAAAAAAAAEANPELANSEPANSEPASPSTIQPLSAGGRLDAEETLLLLDGMVLNVSRWLDEHPGGSGIIPAQALDRDCTVFFEIYHVRERALGYFRMGGAAYYTGQPHTTCNHPGRLSLFR
jgi:cytochrome b involved in lipid metabolism